MSRGCGVEVPICILLNVTTIIGGVIYAVWLAVYDDPVATEQRTKRRAMRREKREEAAKLKAKQKVAKEQAALAREQMALANIGP